MSKNLALFLSLSLLGGISILHQTQAAKEEDLQKIDAALPTQPPAKPSKSHKVLVFSKTNGFRHASIPVGIEALTRLGKKSGAFEVSASEDDSHFEPDKLKEFDGVIMLNTTGDIFRPKDMPADEAAKKAILEREEKLKQSLLEFVKGGKALMGMHSATDTYHGWKEYNDMMGGVFDGHPWHKDVPVANLDPSHPVNAAFDGKGFNITDEIYQFRDDTASPAARRMLLSLDSGKMDLALGKRKDGFYPISWVSKYGEGRIFYCSLGHRDEIYWNPSILKHYLAGIQFALGDLPCDSAPKPVQ